MQSHTMNSFHSILIFLSTIIFTEFEILYNLFARKSESNAPVFETNAVVP